MADDGDQIALPRAFTRRTQKPLSSLWKVTRSTRPARFSRSGAATRAAYLPSSKIAGR